MEHEVDLTAKFFHCAGEDSLQVVLSFCPSRQKTNRE